MTDSEETIFRVFGKCLKNLASDTDNSGNDWSESIVRAFLQGAVKNIEPKIVDRINDEAYYNAQSLDGCWIEFTPGYRYAVRRGDALGNLSCFSVILRKQAEENPAFKTLLEDYVEKL